MSGRTVLAIDIGGTHVKCRVSTDPEKREFPSGPSLTPQQMVAGVKALARDWHFDAVSIGIPAPVFGNRPAHEPANLGSGWVNFDYDRDLARPVKLLNDAAMQAVGSYRAGKMLFLGLGTGLGSCMIAGKVILPLELAHLPYRKGRTFEDAVGLRGLKRLGKKAWRRQVARVVGILRAALLPDEVVLGGGNVAHLKEMPSGCRPGDNANAFIGGFRLWDHEWANAVPIYDDGTPPGQ
ncbi:MAG: ROK family protein [Phycisphaeraceae bacterium]|nr:ROK family protein [Phycisphaeraceae bacterium]